MPEMTPAEAVQEQQQKDARRLVERLEQVSVPDLTVSYTLEKSATVLPGLLARFVAVAVLFRLNSTKKTNLLACSYSRCGRRAHHPLLLWKIWMAMLAVESPKPGTFLRDVDDSVQLRLFLQVMHHEQLPSERRVKGFATQRMAPVIEYLVLWHQFLLLRDGRIEIGAEERDRQRRHARPGTHEDGRGGQVHHTLARMADRRMPPILRAYRANRSQSGRSRDRHEGSAHAKRGKTVHGYGVRFLADLKYGLIWPFAVFPAGDGFRPEISDWVARRKQA